MRLQTAPPWSPLFGTSAEPCPPRTFLALSRHGEEFLFLPTSREAGLCALQLYPAQTPKARIARTIVQGLIHLGLATLLLQRTPSLSTNSPFATFLQSLAHSSTLQEFAVLVGNPHAPGARFIFLVFDSATQPVGVVKAGLSPEARELVRREYRFLCDNSPQFPGLPAPLGFSEESDHTALALPYIEGRSPSADHVAQAGPLLSSWCTDADPIPLGTLPAWQALDNTDPIFQSLPQDLSSLMIHPVLMHGDFAPWNVRVSANGTWNAYDWERGQFPGVPGWDWFHYVVQTSILVRKEAAPQTTQRLESLIGSNTFQAYTAATGIQSHPRPLLIAYLLHAHQLRQTEGAQQIAALLQLIASKPQPFLQPDRP